MEDFFSIILALGLPIIIRYIWGAICRKVAEDKGYSGSSWFWWGFFFALIALIVLITKPNQAPVSKEDNIIKFLQNYKELLDRGIITPEEFEAKKAALLAGPAPTYSPPPAHNKGNTWVCPECGRENPLTVRICPDCGRDK